ncbi:MAG TPA: Obg family GTPase CgtA, partial [Acidimicrobiales bacterium]|nr:Obg family GTPase CgtA [Acidimicrobiales bacterium]
AGAAGPSRATGAGIPLPCEQVVSAVTGEGVPELVARLARLVERARAEEAAPDRGATVLHRPLPEGFAVTRGDDGAFRVEGRDVERAVALNDLTTDEAADYVRGRLRRLGVDRALARAGARDGDLVHIGDLAFVWSRDEPEPSAAGRGRRSR